MARRDYIGDVVPLGRREDLGVAGGTEKSGLAAFATGAARARWCSVPTLSCGPSVSAVTVAWFFGHAVTVSQVKTAASSASRIVVPRVVCTW